MDNNHGAQPLLDHLHEQIEKGLTRARIRGELIHDIGCSARRAPR